MSEQVELVPGFYVDPIPQPNIHVRRLMLATAMLIDGHLDTEPQHFHPYLRNCFLAPRAGIVIAGTRCPRPLMTREVINVSKAVARDAIIVRLGDDWRAADVTFDVYQFGCDEPLLAYRLWMPQPTGLPWLIPSAGEGTFVRFDPDGLDIGDEPPFGSEFDRHRGLVWASEFIGITTKGWF